MKRRIALTGLIAGLLLTVSACGSGDDDSDAKSSSGHNKMDVTFAQQMIPHHEQAVEMAELAATHSQNAEIKELASSIEAAQGPEIETMTGWLESWGEDVPMSGMSSDEMPGMASDDDMPGMMTSDQMSELTAARNGGFDEMFLTMMIAHHEGAIEMARDEQADGKDADAVALAKEIESAQKSEITTMQGMLAK